MRVALDTNILAYVEGVNAGDGRQHAAITLLQELPEGAVIVPVQALGELYNVLVRKLGWPGERARTAVFAWRDAFALLPTSETAMIDAVGLAADYRLGIWDSVMISAAAEGSCRLLLSEDLQHGFSWHGVTIANPFATEQHPLLVALLAGEAGPMAP